ncbi:MAG: immunoglobulin domain-containing protein [Verrucomicrobiota bacterium]|jgi:hypothetical protein
MERKRTAGYLWTKDGVRLTNASGSATSSPAMVTLTTPPTITAQPGSRTVAVGTDTVFSVGVTGTSRLTYLWSKDGSALAGETNAMPT